MQIFKKSNLILIPVLTVLIGLLGGTKALALAQQFNNNKPFNGAKYSLQNGKITTTLTDTPANGAAGQNVSLTFTDSTPNGPNHQYVSDKAIFCAAQTDFRDAVPAKITVSGTPSGKTIQGTLSAFIFGSGSSACTDNGGPITIQNLDTNTGGGGGLPATIAWNGSTYSIVNKAYGFYGLNGGAKGSDCYGGSVIVTNADATSGTAYLGLTENSGPTTLGTSIAQSGISDGNLITLGSGCNFTSGANTSGFTGSISNGKLDAPTPTTPAGDGTGAPTAASCASTFSSGFEWIMCPALDQIDAAAGAFSGFIESQLCVSTGSTSSTGGVVCGGNSIFDSSGSSGVKKAWSIFKDLASALLVIIMLVMVLSQAISAGPFDAYTVRKVLPKLVVAVIAMQLSWYLVKFAIDISNDLGKGIADLMYYPFGGTANLQLDKLIGANLTTHSTGTNDIIVSFAAIAALGGAFAVSLPGLLLLGLYALMALLTGFVVLVFRKLLLVALVILAPLALAAWILPGTENYWKLWKDNFTKLLLMFPMIMALIAAGRIFAYITAGSPPAAGSIFSPHLAIAHLGPLPVPYFGSVTSFVDLAIILVAYFGPYFFLPKTYKWGGTAMTAIGKGVQSSVEKGAKPAKDYLDWRKGLSPWKQARAARKAEVEKGVKLGFYEGLGATGVRGRIRRARLAGVETPASYREIRDNVSRRGRQQVEAEEMKHAQESLQQEIGTMPGTDHDQFLRDILAGNHDATYTDTYGNVHKIGERSEWERVAAVGELTRLGGASNMRAIQEAHARAQTAGGREQELFKKAMDANAGALLPKMKHLYFGGDTPAAIHGLVQGMKAKEFTTMDAIEAETIVGHLTTRIEGSRTTMAAHPSGSAEYLAAQAAHEEASTDLATFTSAFQQAITSDTTKDDVSPAIARAMKALVDGSGVGAINSPRIDPATGAPRPGSPTIVERTYDPTTGITTDLGNDLIAANPTLASTLGYLHTHIDNSGNILP